MERNPGDDSTLSGAEKRFGVAKAWVAEEAPPEGGSQAQRSFTRVTVGDLKPDILEQISDEDRGAQVGIRVTWSTFLCSGFLGLGVVNGAERNFDVVTSLHTSGGVKRADVFKPACSFWGTHSCVLSWNMEQPSQLRGGHSVFVGETQPAEAWDGIAVPSRHVRYTSFAEASRNVCTSRLQEFRL